MTLPGSPFVAYRDGQLHVDGCALDALADQYGTPLYVYSQAAMLAALAPYERALAGRKHLVCYAMKANSSLAVLQTFARAGCGFDIVSAGELERVLAAGGRADRVVFSGVGKTRAEMRRALEAGVRCFNVESEAELEVLSEVAASLGRRAPVSLRVNPDVDAKTHPYISTGLRDNKFGIAHDRAVAAYRRAAALPGLQVTGIDCHIGSQITEVAPYLDALDRVLDLVEAVEAAGIPIHHVDLGGGLGITYTDETPPAADELIARLLERIDARGHGHRELLFEPGRSLVGNAGVLVTEVLYLKPGEEKNFCIVDAAMNDLMRPAMYEAWMATAACRLRDEPPQRYDVVGPVCESGDWLARDRLLAVRQGDRIAVLSAGAYGMSMASNYNTRGRAAEVMVIDGQAHLIRERETPQDLFRGERLLG
ncbi:diaminopimelate decarboxylase [Caldimonas thermodepolymerans]|uniref:Diaminopimelate decarboxylase n=1 Tax=Caldimonas thermodepolymerans TaxID=215580 RepID=A0AA46HW78_9BURK|nr:diaminopimelate decarboxylase [Caldimonas thermodepolymerans]TCP08082.1 diaminopimelate decarboxylase [Caldimonas thermodepolymerans]UZG48796.1 diaminopimelate decarboxylase [Caldimonas thermodepolymerans]